MTAALTEIANGRTHSFTELQSSPTVAAGVIDAQHAHYSLFYETNVSDTSPESRRSIIIRLNGAIPGMRRGGVILNLGSGRQPLEDEHIKEFGVPGIVYSETGAYVHAYNFLTVDHAALDEDQLLAREAPHVSHIRASGDKLDMIADASIDIAISNLALDFMPREAVAELYRVLVPGGKVFLNLSNSRLVTSDNLDDSFARLNKKMFGNKWNRRKPQKTKDVQELLMLRNRRMLRDAHWLFEDKDQIRNAFTAYGFSVTCITPFQEQDKDRSRLWEVDLQKPTEHDQALQTFSKNLEHALSFDEDDFTKSARRLYFRYLPSNSIVARQSIAARVVAAWNPENGDIYRPDPSILLEGSVNFAARGAKAVEKGSDHWWIQIAMGLVSAERPVTESGVLKFLPIASDGRVHGNRNTRDQIMMQYKKLLSE